MSPAPPAAADPGKQPDPVFGSRATRARVAALVLPGLGQLVLRRYAVAAALLLLTAASLVFIALCFVQLLHVVGDAWAAAAGDGMPVEPGAGLVPAVKLGLEVLILLGLYVWGFVDVVLALRRARPTA